MPNANELRQSLFEAMEIFSKDISQKTNDKALELECKIDRVRDRNIGEYIVEYQGSKMIVYSPKREIYQVGDIVYILVPEGDFSKTKYIIGYVTPKINDETITLNWDADINKIEVFRGEKSIGFLETNSSEKKLNSVYYTL